MFSTCKFFSVGPTTSVDNKSNNKDTKVGILEKDKDHKDSIDNFPKDAFDDITEANEIFSEKNKDGEDQTEYYTETKDKSESHDRTECNTDTGVENINSSEAVGDHGGTLEPEGINHLQTPQTSAASSLREGASAVKNAARSKASSLTSTIKGLLNSTNHEVYREKKTISLPFKHGPKVYNRIIRYRIADSNQAYSPVVTVKITSTPRANHENTHLFMRFTRL